MDDLRAATASLSRSVSNELRATAEQLRPLGARLSALAESPETAAAAETREVLKSLGLELLRLSVVIAIVLLGAVVWRVLALRYIADGYRRRLLMTARTFVVTTAIALVIVFHFTSELTPLVTALGFAAAGIAFALQNVILALVGYFAMLSPNGIRVGDRVSLQGPFAVRLRRGHGDRLPADPAARAGPRAANPHRTDRRLSELRGLHRDLLQASRRRSGGAAQTLSIAFASSRAPS